MASGSNVSLPARAPGAGAGALFAVEGELAPDAVGFVLVTLDSPARFACFTSECAVSLTLAGFAVSVLARSVFCFGFCGSVIAAASAAFCGSVIAAASAALQRVPHDRRDRARWRVARRPMGHLGQAG
jgi:hypothetical protein